MSININFKDNSLHNYYNTYSINKWISILFGSLQSGRKIIPTIYLLITILLFGCGGGGEGGDSDDNNDSNNSNDSGSDVVDIVPGVCDCSNISARDLVNFNVNNADETDLSLYYSDMYEFEIPSDSISFQITISGNSKIGYYSLINPKGKDVLNDLDFIPAKQSVNSLSVPMLPQMKVYSGKWKFGVFSLFNENIQIDTKLSIRQGRASYGGLIKIKPFLTGSDYNTKQIQNVLIGMKEIFDETKLELEFEEVTVIPDASFGVVNKNFDDPHTSALMAQGDDDKVNLFFVEDLSGFYLGIAGGIPGPHGIKGNRNGVLIGISAHLVGSEIDYPLISETASHEMGHWLGLYHSSERNGRDFDMLRDTPECSIDLDGSFDGIKNGQVDIDECIGNGSRNLMFWAGRSDLDQKKISTHQEYIINYAPITR